MKWTTTTTVHENEAILVPLMIYMDVTELARMMAITMAERDKKKYKRSGDIIEHVKKCRAYDFYGTLDLEQTDKWIKIIEEAFITL